MVSNKDYVNAVNSGNFPDEVQVPIDAPFRDTRGEILNVWLGSSNSITYITTKKGSVRAEHKHTLEFHGCYLIEGSVEYTERNNVGEITFKKIFNAGDLFFSKPKIWHKMLFLEDTKMITINNIVKNHDNYENDLTRIKYED